MNRVILSLLLVNFLSIQGYLANDIEPENLRKEEILNEDVIQKETTEAFKNEIVGNVEEKTKGHILFFHNAGTRSHLIALNGLVESLVEHGYEVTTVFYAKSKFEHKNYNQIVIEDRYIVEYIHLFRIFSKIKYYKPYA